MKVFQMNGDDVVVGQKSKALMNAIPNRVPFNPSNKLHRASLKQFLETGRWGQILFVAELPHVEVPTTVLNKLARHSLGIK